MDAPLACIDPDRCLTLLESPTAADHTHQGLCTTDPRRMVSEEQRNAAHRREPIGVEPCQCVSIEFVSEPVRDMDELFAYCLRCGAGLGRVV
jgi:hypothetical protein